MSDLGVNDGMQLVLVITPQSHQTDAGEGTGILLQS